MIDLLGDVLRCDMCAEKKERRYFAMIADGDIKDLTICADCADLEARTMLEEKKNQKQINILQYMSNEEIRKLMVYFQTRKTSCNNPVQIARFEMCEKAIQQEMHGRMPDFFPLEV